jgi:hypothetical protein
MLGAAGLGRVRRLPARRASMTTRYSAAVAFRATCRLRSRCQPRGDRNDITAHDEPVIRDQRSTDEPPLTFAAAEQHNAYALLTELHDHALTFDVEGKRPSDPKHHLAELALSAAVVAWWSRWQPITMHRALLAGANLAEVAAAAGTTEAEAYTQWSGWADTQSELIIAGRRGVDPDEAAAIRARLGFSGPAT